MVPFPPRRPAIHARPTRRARVSSADLYIALVSLYTRATAKYGRLVNATAAAAVRDGPGAARELLAEAVAAEARVFAIQDMLKVCGTRNPLTPAGGPGGSVDS